MSKTKVEVTNRYIEGLYYYFKVSSRDIPRSSAAGSFTFPNIDEQKYFLF